MSSLAYSDLKRPVKDKEAIHSNVYNTVGSSFIQESAAFRKSGGTDCAADEEGLGLDTWSRFLVKLNYHLKDREREKEKGRDLGRSTDVDRDEKDRSLVFPFEEEEKITQIVGDKVLPLNQILSTLQILIAFQNEHIQILRRKVISQKRLEGQVRLKKFSEEKGTVGMENTTSALVWHDVLHVSRTRWQQITSSIFSTRETVKGRPLYKKCKATDNDLNGNDRKPSLPSLLQLYECLVEGVNSDETANLIQQKFKNSVSSVGIEKAGLLTDFKQHLHIFSYYHTLIPSLKGIRLLFRDLLTSGVTPYDHLGNSLMLYEMQLDYLLRVGESTKLLQPMLREGLHPSVRRLVYARVLQIPLSVTGGEPLIPPSANEITNNSHSAASLASYLTLATKYSRDKIKRRCQHHYSSANQESVVATLQSLILNDTLEYVGDSDKYFVYEDEVKILLQSLVADKSVPDSKIKDALDQLGRSENCLDSYIVYLLSQEGNLVHQRAPPCGFVPVAGFSLLSAPLACVTGDTVEQYELLTAMTAQLWVRLQGPTPELLQCCMLFEEIISQVSLPASLHMRRVLKMSPLELALEWMMTGFADLFDPMELLSLYDIILAYHIDEIRDRSCLSRPVGLISLEDDDIDVEEKRTGDESSQGDNAAIPPCALWILPVLAAGLFTFRAPIIEKCTNKNEVKSLFSSGHQLQVRSLLRMILSEYEF